MERERKVVSRCSSSSSEPEPTQEVKANEPATPSQPSGNDTLKISVFNTATEKTVELKAKPSLKIQKIMEVLKAHYGIPCDDQRLYYDGERVLPDDTLGSLGVENGDQLELMPVLKGAKPVIYLYPTTATRISTTLSLVPEWEFSAIYPVVPAKSTENGQELKWVVDAQPSGILTEVATGMEVSYLYWEAETTGKGLVSPPLSPIPGATTVEAPFVPNRASLDSKDTVLLEVAKITPYLDGALKALGLHVEARTSFVTYWLPTLLKHEYVALRFLPQSAYEHAAPLKIDPIPDVVSRIFMLFKGVDKSDLAVWSEARERAVEDVGRWTDVVGVDVEKVQDAGLFRVIEWGGMEVLV
ncbi:hypothetical protein DFP72DRAFT_820699 [Ephemerocybe angulata]|uniref:Ubiquitin-like domain-containing protein n=1 Tax=Ephemerocybe angulata TaxID=980116 RepID=A0A8H6HM41_9AGAR|nr:hypothetical protein DFP72DRAFT_820699 [Tulosesus angulatus]